jgi:hypothetical protein
MGLWVGVYRKANTKWSPLLRQCEQRTRGAIRNLGRGIRGTRAALFSGPAQSLPMNERNSIRDRSLIQGHLDFSLAFVFTRTHPCRNSIQLFSIHSPASKTPVGELLGHFLDVLSERKYAQ